MSKFEQIFYSWVKDFDDNILDKMPEKSRKVLESKIRRALKTIEKILEGK